MIRKEKDLKFNLEAFDKISTMDELEKFMEKAFIDNLGYVPFYMEVKPGFGQHANNILNDVLEENENGVQVNLLAKTLLRRTEEFNRAFYPHLLNLPNGVFASVNDYMLGNSEHPYIPGQKLEPYDKGGNIGFILYGDNKSVIDLVRSRQGSTGNPAPGTIRYNYGLKDTEGNVRPSKTANVIHCSDGCVSALKELYMAVATPNTWGASATVIDIKHNNMHRLLDLMYFTSMVHGAVVEKEQEIHSKQKEEVVDKKITPAQKRLAVIIQENKSNKTNEVPASPSNDGREGK